MNVQLALAAAGMGARLGSELPKALAPLCGEPMVARALRRFSALGLVEGAIILVPPGRGPQFAHALDGRFPGAEFTFVAGGARRQDSIRKALTHLSPETDIVVIHDAARPFVGEESIKASIAAAIEHGAATVAIPCVDTILRAGEHEFLADTPDRSRLWACQTPQTFRVEIIRDAHERALKQDLGVTDDATLVRAFGHKVKLVEGSASNFKITTPHDLALADLMCREGFA